MITILIKTLIKLIRHLNIRNHFSQYAALSAVAMIEQICSFISTNQANESDENSANHNETRARQSFQKGFNPNWPKINHSALFGTICSIKII